MGWENALSGLLGAGATAALGTYGINQADLLGKTQQANMNTYGAALASGAQFKPYTVTSGTGATNINASGLTSQLSPEQQAAQQQLMSGGLGLMQGAMMPVQDRATALQSQFDAMRAPQNQRDALALEQRMFNQGRTGVQTAQYGGTPEQLAMFKAMQEQRSQDALMSRQQAFGEQQQMATIGSGMFNQSYLPEQQLLAQQQMAYPFLQTANQNQLTGILGQAQAQQAGSEAALQSGQQANALRQIYLQQALQGLTSPQYSFTDGVMSSGGSLLGDIFRGITGKGWG
jgi:hypothetical protein